MWISDDVHISLKETSKLSLQSELVCNTRNLIMKSESGEAMHIDQAFDYPVRVGKHNIGASYVVVDDNLEYTLNCLECGAEEQVSVPISEGNETAFEIARLYAFGSFAKECQ